jgi:hypothetical protein
VFFVFSWAFMFFSGIQASSAGLFDIKKKEACPARTNKIPILRPSPLKEGIQPRLIFKQNQDH